MRDNDGRKLDHQTLEQLRIRAVQQIQDGVHPEEVAAALGMTRAAVYGWLAKYREGGLEALKARPVPGRPPKLQGPQLARLYGLVVGNDPRQLRFAFALWTRAMVRELIRREFGVRLSEVSVGRLLRTLGLSPQRPLYRAYQQNPEAVTRWKAEIYPAIRTQAQQVGATIYFADEAGVRSDYHAGTTWAPVGQTPVVAATGDRFGVNLISAVTARGKLRFAAYEGSLNGPVFIDFCRRLLHDTPGPVFLVLDGHPVHRSNAVKQFAASTGGRLRLFFLPGYSPELNPGEWVWKHVKHDRIGRAGVSGPEELKAKGVGGAAPAAEAAAPGAQLLPGSQPALHHRLKVHLLTFALGNTLKGLLVTAPAELREQLRGRSTTRLVQAAAALEPGPVTSPMAAATLALGILARRHQSLSAEIDTLTTQLERLVTTAAPELVARFGVGHDSAGALLVAAGDNPHRLTSEAAFSMLCGASPIPASSGKTTRHRLNRGGDRQANAALHRIVIVRLRYHQPTRDYMTRRLAQGKTKKEIIRCLKRYVAREVFAVLYQMHHDNLIPAA